MVKLRDYKPIKGDVKYHNCITDDIDREIREHGKAICYLDDVELAYIIRKKYTVKCIDEYYTFVIPYVTCEVTRG